MLFILIAETNCLHNSRQGGSQRIQHCHRTTKESRSPSVIPCFAHSIYIFDSWSCSVRSTRSTASYRRKPTAESNQLRTGRLADGISISLRLTVLFWKTNNSEKNCKGIDCRWATKCAGDAQKEANIFLTILVCCLDRGIARVQDDARR